MKMKRKRKEKKNTITSEQKASVVVKASPAEKDNAVRATSGTTILIQADIQTNTALCGARGRNPQRSLRLAFTNQSFKAVEQRGGLAGL